MRMIPKRDVPERMPAEAFPPSEFIKEELQERGWTADDFARQIGWSRDTLAALLESDAPLTMQQAADIGRGFGTSDRFWMDLNWSYRRWLGRVEFNGVPGYRLTATETPDGQGG